MHPHAAVRQGRGTNKTSGARDHGCACIGRRRAKRTGTTAENEDINPSTATTTVLCKLVTRPLAHSTDTQKAIGFYARQLQRPSKAQERELQAYILQMMPERHKALPAYIATRARQTQSAQPRQRRCKLSAECRKYLADIWYVT